MSDTPRMDSAFKQLTPTTPRMNWQLDQCYKEGCKLERELAEANEERDELKSKYRTHHDEAERITNEIRRVSSVCRELERELAAERALTDRLVKVVECSAKIIGPPDGDHDSRWVTDDELDDLWDRTQSALAAVKGGSDD